MDANLVGTISLICLVPLLAAGFPIAPMFILLGLTGLTLIINFDVAQGMLAQALYHSVASPNWAALPLFILMGTLASVAGFAKQAFDGMSALTRGVTGALGIATCYSCAAFGAISGSSAATGAIFARLAIPEMRRLGYDKVFATGIVASAGTFAAMIPPSGLMIVYALLTQQSIGKLFAAGVVPGLLTATLYALSIYLRIRNNPSLAKDEASQAPGDMRERLAAARDLVPVALVAVVVLGGIYGGFFTPTEAAGVGCLITFIFGIAQKGLTKPGVLRSALRDSARTSAMIFFVIIAAIFFSRYLAVTQIPSDLTRWIANMGVADSIIMLCILAIWFFLGMVMLPEGIFALTIPLVFPLITSLGYDPIWFGVIAIKLSEIANVTPPVGINIFAIQGTAGDDVNVVDVYKGVWPFVVADVLILAVLVIFPDVCLFLPRLLFG